MLECSRGITVSLLHGMAHECAIDRREGGLPYIVRFDVYLFVRVRHVDLGSIFSSSNVHTDLLLVREGRDVLLCIVVSFSTVDYGPVRTLNYYSDLLY